ncbi:cupin domain-containing protein [Candidatus Binatia bacterium]|nr:cupin domain-containing protein [Candidatus Binatia bacterium]
MKRPTTVDAARAAALVLGALPEDARSELEQRMAASPALREEIESLRAIADELLLAPPPVAPHPALRERVLARVAAEAAAASSGAVNATAPATRPPLPDLLFALEPDAVWKDVAPGLQRRLLSRGPDATSYVLRVAPGVTIPSHDHACVEHLFVLSGSIDVEGTLCHAGDYHRAAQGTHHAMPYSAEGCVVLVVESVP